MAKQIEVARHLYMTDRNFRVLQEKGVFEHKGRGGYDADDCRRRYIEYLRSLSRRSADDQPDDELAVARQRVVDGINVERARLAAEQADKAAMDNAMRRREVVPVAVLEDYAERVGTFVRGMLEALPAQLKRRIHHLRASEVNVIKQEVAKLSDGIATYDLDHEGST